MNDINPYKIKIQKSRKRFKAEAVGNVPLEIVNTRTGEVRHATQLAGSQKWYDTSDFVKLFNPKAFVGLGTAAVSVLAYIISVLTYNGYSSINYSECAAYCNYKSRQQVYRGLQELKHKDIIRAKSRGQYWVNPNIIWRGQRM